LSDFVIVVSYKSDDQGNIALSQNFSKIHYKLLDPQLIQVRAIDNARAHYEANFSTPIIKLHYGKTCFKSYTFIFLMKITCIMHVKKAHDVLFHVVYSKSVRRNS
jgi:hypothetical protein